MKKLKERQIKISENNTKVLILLDENGNVYKDYKTIIDEIKLK